MKFAVITTGGKQYITEEGGHLFVEKLVGETGSIVNFPHVLLFTDGAESQIGSPYVAGKSVTGEIIEQGRAKKIIVLKYKAKSRYKKKNGHRQPYTKVKIISI